MIDRVEYGQEFFFEFSFRFRPWYVFLLACDLLANGELVGVGEFLNQGWKMQSILVVHRLSGNALISVQMILRREIVLAAH